MMDLGIAMGTLMVRSERLIPITVFDEQTLEDALGADLSSQEDAVSSFLKVVGY
jgi:hypothetical protein